MSLPTIFPLFCVLLLIGCRSPENKKQKRNPNIIILLADDLGYGDLGCYGGAAATPHLDQLATEGIRFTDFHSAAPNCSPSRAGMLTGRMPSKLGIYNYLPLGHPMHLRAEEITIAEIAQQKNYATAHFGKWHVSTLSADRDVSQPQPADQGFDYSLGTSNNAIPSHLNPTNFIRNGSKVGDMPGYSCQIIVDEALAWMTSLKADDHFLMYLAFHEPHKKVASPPELVQKYSDHPKPDAEYLANVENMDMAIGRVLKQLAKQGIVENTLVLFASDNGSYRNGSNGNLLGGKSFVYEGGIRVPGILRWPERIAPNQVDHTTTSLLDIMPTICEVLDVSHSESSTLDGTSMLPLLEGKELKRKKPLSWFFYRTSPQIALRYQDHIILASDSDTSHHTHPFTIADMAYIKNLTLKRFEIFDLSKDLGQSHGFDPGSTQQGKMMQSLLQDRLDEIIQIGPTWTGLPESIGIKKLKSEWRQLR